MARYKFFAARCSGGPFRIVMETDGEKIAAYHKNDIAKGGHAGKRWKMTDDGRRAWGFKPSRCS